MLRILLSVSALCSLSWSLPIGNLTYQRLRECKMNGYQVLLSSDRIQFDGKNILTLDTNSNTWMALVPEATTRQGSRDSDGIQLQERCLELMKELGRPDNYSAEQSLLIVFVPVVAGLTFFGLVLLSFMVVKIQDKKNSRQPGGVLGSIIHYPPGSLEVPLRGESELSPSNLSPASKCLY